MRIPLIGINISFIPLSFVSHWLLPQQPIAESGSTTAKGSLTFHHKHAYIANPSLPHSFLLPNQRQPPQIIFTSALSPPDISVARNPDDYTGAGQHPMQLKTVSVNLRRPLRDLNVRSTTDQCDLVEWSEEEEVLSPDVEDKSTLTTLAMITGDAYARPGDKDWWDVGGKWNSVSVVAL